MTDLTQIDKEIFKKKLKEIKGYKGRNTELISLFIPYGTDRSTVMSQLTGEINQSSNIKSPSTRKNVQGALRKIIQFIKMTNFDIPKNGIVLYSGNVSEIDGKVDIRIFYVTPPKELPLKLYRCDSSFYIEPLEDMIEPDRLYGIIAVDNKEATIAILSGKKYRVVAHLTSAVPGKIKAGGQSAARFERLRIDAQNEFYSRISDKINKEYLHLADKIEAIVIGGPGFTKKKMVDRELIDYRLRKKIIGYLDVTYTDESGIKEIIDLSEDLLRDTEIKKEQAILNKFMEAVVKSQTAAYGVKEVLEVLEQGRAELVIISEGFNWNLSEFICEDCEHTFESRQENPICEKCSSHRVERIKTVEPIEYILKLAKKISAQVHLVSQDTIEGQQFFNTFGGLGAILRY